MLYSLVEHKDLTNYIASLPKSIVDKIFDYPTTCLALFRELPEMAKIIVVRLLLLSQEVPQATVNSWIDSKYQKDILSATQILTNLGVLQDVRSQGGMPVWLLKQSFKDNLFQGIFLTGGTKTETFLNLTTPMETDQQQQQQQNADPEFLEKLDNYATERWESVLKYIVNPKDPKNQIGISTKEVLKYAGLMKSTGPGGESSR